MIRLVYITVFSLLFLPSRAEVYEYAASVWPVSFDTWDKSPYGCFIIKELLQDLTDPDSVERVRQDLHSFMKKHTSERKSLYVLPGKDLFFRDVDWKALKAFAERGNVVLIAAEQVPDEIWQEFLEKDFSSRAKPTVTMQFEEGDSLQEAFSFTYMQNFEPTYRQWPVIDERTIREEVWYQVICRTNDAYSNINLIKIMVGDGEIYLFTTPLLLTNYALKQPGGLAYINHMLNGMDFNKVYWDEYVRYPYGNLIKNSQTVHGRNESWGGGGSGNGENFRSPLHFMLSNRSLSLAYIFLIVLILLYVLVNSKRRIRAIPIGERKENMSVQFADTVGRMYFQEGKHYHLVRQQERIFLHHVKKRYRMDVRNMTEQDKTKLALRSGVAGQHIDILFNAFKKGRASEKFTDQEIQQIHQIIQEFD